MTLEQLRRIVARTPHRGVCHVFLGHPASDAADKTTVEPGNVFSPGVWTCGISWWLIDGEEVIAPDRLAPEEVSWHFGGEGDTPVLHAAYGTPSICLRSRLVHRGGEGAEGCDFEEIRLSANAAKSAQVALVIRPVGPAGGTAGLFTLDAERRELLCESGLRVTLDATPAGHWLAETQPENPCAPLALLLFACTPGPGGDAVIHLRAEHGFLGRTFSRELGLARPHANAGFSAARTKAVEEWAAALPARVTAPDERIALTWQRSAWHILAAMDNNLPRIGTVNYPHFWMRDGVIILRALDVIGRSDLARIGVEFLAPRDFAGGFGAEADAPGEGIWSLVQHAFITGDDAWLDAQHEHIARRVAWIDRMRSAAGPVRACIDGVMPRYALAPGSRVVCLAADNGLVNGRMDWHRPNVYINVWCLAGLHWAAEAARRVNWPEETAWRAHADELRRRVVSRLLPVYGNTRDPAVAPSPSGVLADCPELREAFAAWFRTHRVDDNGRRIPEPLWTYFEAAQIRNAVRLGLVDEAWTCLDGMLDEACSPWGISAWREGQPGDNESLPFRNDAGALGWLDRQHALAGNMPHNWTSAEMLLTLRAVFVDDDGERLVLGAGVPAAWLREGALFGVHAMPTRLGPVSFTARVHGGRRISMEYDGPSNPVYGWKRHGCLTAME